MARRAMMEEDNSASGEARMVEEYSASAEAAVDENSVSAVGKTAGWGDGNGARKVPMHRSFPFCVAS